MRRAPKGPIVRVDGLIRTKIQVRNFTKRRTKPIRAIIRHFATTTHTSHCRKCTNRPILDASHENESISPGCAGTRYLHDLKCRGAC